MVDPRSREQELGGIWVSGFYILCSEIFWDCLVQNWIVCILPYIYVYTEESVNYDTNDKHNTLQFTVLVDTVDGEISRYYVALAVTAVNTLLRQTLRGNPVEALIIVKKG